MTRSHWILSKLQRLCWKCLPLFTVTVLTGLVNKGIKLLKLFTCMHATDMMYKVSPGFTDTVISFSQCIWYHGNAGPWKDRGRHHPRRVIMSGWCQEIWCKIHYSVMAQGKMAPMASTRRFFMMAPYLKMLRASICSTGQQKFLAFMKKWRFTSNSARIIWTMMNRDYQKLPKQTKEVHLENNYADRISNDF